MNQLQLLHISDLHIKEKEEDFDRSLVLDSLIERIKFDIEKGIKPEIVIVTGDIAFKGIAPEYRLAKAFFDRLLACLELPKERLFIVPGNHDVNRNEYRPNDIPTYKNIQELNEQLENEIYRQDLLKGMNDYFKFKLENYPHLKSKHGNIVPFVIHYRCECGKNIGINGLNSAWMCRKSPDMGHIAVGPYQVKKAIDELEEKGDMDIVINCLHHPLDWLWNEDRNRCRRYFNNTVLLTGHLHDTSGGFIDDLDGALYQFKAGGAYLGSESAWPQRFHYITFDWKEKYIKLNFRRYVKERCKWCLDGETGDDGEKILKMIHFRSKPAGSASKYPIIKTLRPFQPCGMLPQNAISYINRRCDEELEQYVGSKEKKLIAINGDFEIGKSSLLNRVMHVPFLKDGNWKRVFLDIQGLFPLENIMQYFFKQLSSEVNCKINSWRTLVRFIKDHRLVLCFDEFEILRAYRENCKNFMRNLYACAKESDNIRVVLCLRIPIGEFIEHLSEPSFELPEYINCWKNIAIKPFNSNQAIKLLNLLPNHAKKVALNKFDIIEKFSSFKPRPLQCLCDNLFDAVIDNAAEAKLVEIIDNESSYS